MLINWVAAPERIDVDDAEVDLLDSPPVPIVSDWPEQQAGPSATMVEATAAQAPTRKRSRGISLADASAKKRRADGDSIKATVQAVRRTTVPVDAQFFEHADSFVGRLRQFRQITRNPTKWARSEAALTWDILCNVAGDEFVHTWIL